MRIGITSNCAIHDLRIGLIPRLREFGYDVMGRGPATSEYTDYVKWGVQLAREMAIVRFDAGIAVCGSGIGTFIATNRVGGIRAVCVSEIYSVVMSRRRSNANALCFDSRVVGPDVALAICEAFLGTSSKGGRYAGWVAQLRQFDVGDVSFLDEGC